jgi:hypothetical protein
MRIPPEEIKTLLRSALVTTRRPKRRSIDRLLSEVRRSMQTTLDEHMQAPMVLFDEAVRFIMAFEEFQFSRKLKAESSDFAMHTTRLRSDLLAVREMVKLGQESAALALARVFFEDIEIAMGLAIDPEFAIAYGESAGDDAFWSKNIGYGKIYPKVRKFLETGGGDLKHAEQQLSHHKELKSFLSGHIHPTTSSAFHAVFPPAPDHPGMFLKRPLGSLGKNLRPLCLTLADEVHMFAACCINMFISPVPPPAFAGYEPCGEFDDFLASAHILQELIVKYLEPLWREHIETSAAWKAGLSDDET